ncbi:MAG TPA: hypothetical protein O0W95_05630, partial [Methanocorpusculum sp.]|nr:hypothetical protein [Methanocorpusculum sp.]
DNLLAHAEKVSAAMKFGDPKTGISALKNAASAASGNPYLLAGLGYMSAISGKPSEALTFFDKAEAAGCTDIDVNCSRAFIYLGQNRYDLALPEAAKAVEKDSGNAVAWRLKAKAHEGLGEFEQAVECYTMSLNPASGKDETDSSDDGFSGDSMSDVNESAKADDGKGDLYGGSRIKDLSQKENSSAPAQKERLTPSNDAASNRRRAFGDSDAFGGDSNRGKKQRGFIIN